MTITKEEEEIIEKYLHVKDPTLLDSIPIERLSLFFETFEQSSVSPQTQVKTVNLESHPVFQNSLKKETLDNFLNLRNEDFLNFKTLSKELEKELEISSETLSQNEGIPGISVIESMGEKLNGNFQDANNQERGTFEEDIDIVLGEIRDNMNYSTSYGLNRKIAWSNLEEETKIPKLENSEYILHGILENAKVEDFYSKNTPTEVSFRDIYTQNSKCKFWPSCASKNSKKKRRKKSSNALKENHKESTGEILSSEDREKLSCSYLEKDSDLLNSEEKEIEIEKLPCSYLEKDSDLQVDKESDSCELILRSEDIIRKNDTPKESDNEDMSCVGNIQLSKEKITPLNPSYKERSISQETLHSEEISMTGVEKEDISHIDEILHSEANTLQENMADIPINLINDLENGAISSNSVFEDVKDKSLENLKEKRLHNELKFFDSSDYSYKVHTDQDRSKETDIKNPEIMDKGDDSFNLSKEAKSSSEKKKKKEKKKIRPKITSKIIKQVRTPTQQLQNLTQNIGASNLSNAILPHSILSEMIRDAPISSDLPMPEYDWNFFPESPSPESFYDHEDVFYPEIVADVAVQVTPNSELSFEIQKYEVEEVETEEEFSEVHNHNHTQYGYVDVDDHCKDERQKDIHLRKFISTALHPSDFQKHGLVHQPPLGYTYVHTLGYIPFSQEPYPIYILIPLSELDPELHHYFDADIFDTSEAATFLFNRWDLAKKNVAVIREQDLSLLTPNQNAWISFSSFSN